MRPGHRCQCESELCPHHGPAVCPSTDTRPAPVMYLHGSPLCDACIDELTRAGYGLSDSPYNTERAA